MFWSDREISLRVVGGPLRMRGVDITPFAMGGAGATSHLHADTRHERRRRRRMRTRTKRQQEAAGGKRDTEGAEVGERKEGVCGGGREHEGSGSS